MFDNRRTDGRGEPDAEATARGYEARDLRLAPLVLLVGGFVVTFAMLCGGLWLLYTRLTSTTAALPRSAVTAVTTSDAPPLQPQPGHEALDAWDLAEMRKQEDATFERLGWMRDPRTHRFTPPAEVVIAVQDRNAATRPSGGR